MINTESCSDASCDRPPNYKSTGPKIDRKATNFLNLRSYNSHDRPKSRRISNQHRNTQDRNNSVNHIVRHNQKSHDLPFIGAQTYLLQNSLK